MTEPRWETVPVDTLQRALTYLTQLGDGGQFPPWLPAGFESLSGLPTLERKRAVLMPVQVCVDDSGYPGQSPAFVMAGLIGRAEEWAAFSDKWRECLEAEPQIRYCKMQEAATKKGQFANWSDGSRDRKLRALADVIVAFPFRQIRATIKNEGEVFPHATPLQAHSYFQAFYILLAASAFDLLSHGEREAFEIIFDENPSLGERTRRWWPMVRILAPANIVDLLPTEPVFRNDHRFAPLQAADMLTWLVRRDLSGQANRFKWLREKLDAVPSSPFCQHYDGDEYKRLLVAHAERLRAFRPPDSFFDELRKVSNEEIKQLKQEDG